MSKDKRAKRLQEQTGWSYTECLRLSREFTDEQIEGLIAIRKPGDAKEGARGGGKASTRERT